MFIGSVRNASAFLKEILDCMKLLRLSKKV
jgi:hypothetical protein